MESRERRRDRAVVFLPQLGGNLPVEDFPDLHVAEPITPVRRFDEAMHFPERSERAKHRDGFRTQGTREDVRREFVPDDGGDLEDVAILGRQPFQPARDDVVDAGSLPLW